MSTSARLPPSLGVVTPKRWRGQLDDYQKQSLVWEKSLGIECDKCCSIESRITELEDEMCRLRAEIVTLKLQLPVPVV